MEDASPPKTVLVVDDERYTVRHAVEERQAAGYATAQACDGVEAMEWLEANLLPEIILLDITLRSLTIPVLS